MPVLPMRMRRNRQWGAHMKGLQPDGCCADDGFEHLCWENFSLTDHIHGQAGASIIHGQDDTTHGKVGSSEF